MTDSRDSSGKLVVIGGDAAGMTAASRVRRRRREREIVVLERGPHTSYAACGMPYYFAGMIPAAENLIARTPEAFRSKMNIDVRTRHEVTDLDTSGSVAVRDLETGEEYRESYDELLIATGARPIVPPVPGIGAHGVFSLSTLQSGIELEEYIERRRPTRAVVVGGGYIGIEMAEALQLRGMEVALIDMAPQVMPTMDSDSARIIADYMREQGIELRLEESLRSIDVNSREQVAAVVTENARLPTDVVVTGVGVAPDSDLAARAGIELGTANAVRVNRKLETSHAGIWAAGDCAESYHLVTGAKVFVALGTVANKHGLVAGTNISGGTKEFPGVVGTAITKFHDLEIARTGISEREADQHGLSAEAATITSETRAGYYPGSGKITVKLVVEAETRRIIGGQIVGMEGAGKRIDTLATAVTAGMTAQNLVDLDLAYAPPFSPVWDPVQTAARRLSG